MPCPYAFRSIEKENRNMKLRATAIRVAALSAAVMIVLSVLSCAPIPKLDFSGANLSHGTEAGIPGLRDRYTVLRGDGTDRATVMFYMIGSDLEEYHEAATADLGEILDAGSSPRLDLVFQTGGCLDWQNDALTDGKVERFHADRGELTFCEDLGTVDMLDPVTLSGFIRWAADEYPADRYILILWDHGGGVLDGFGFDDNFPDSSLGINELAGAIADSGIKFDTVGFDACFMAAFEAAFALEPYADYLIASEETEPVGGWEYTDWIGALSEDPAADSVKLAEELITEYVFAESEDDEYDLRSLSLVDLREVPYVAEKLSEMLCGKNAPSSDEVAEARLSLTEFGGKYYDQVDLLDFAGRFGTDEAKELKKAVSSAVKLNGSNFFGANGLSLYFPCRYPYAYNKNARDILVSVGFSSDYVKYLGSFARIMESRARDGVVIPAWYDPSAEFSYEDGEIRTLYMINKRGDKAIRFDDEEYLSIEEVALHMSLFDGESWIDLGYDCNYMFDDDGDLLFNPDLCWIALDGLTVPFFALADEEQGNAVYSYGVVPAWLNKEKEIEIVVYWDNTYAGGYVAGYRITDGDKDALFGFVPGDSIEVLVDSYTPDGEYEGEFVWGDPIEVTDGRISVSYEYVDQYDVRVFYRVVFSDGGVGCSDEITIPAVGIQSNK